MGWTHFLMKTHEHVGTEMSLHVLAYNLKRVINILGVETLVEAIMAKYLCRKPLYERLVSLLRDVLEARPSSKLLALRVRMSANARRHTSPERSPLTTS